jgi:tripartite-type tricarboxylate transporter receptor subunit TctC
MKTFLRTRRLALGSMGIGAFVALGLSTWASQSLAQDYPNKTVRFITASAGSPQDVVGRIFGQKVAESWGQGVYIESKPGAGALISMQSAAKSAPDGYTVLISSAAFTVTPYLYKNIGFDLDKDLVPLGLLATTPNIIVTSPASGLKSIKDVVEKARAGRKIQYGSPGFGTTPQLSAEYLFKILASQPLMHVPYKGIPPVVAAAMGGEVDVASMSLPPAVQLIKSGKLIGLAVTSAKRNASVPDVPTIAETGYPGFEDDSWVGAWVPAGTPPGVLKKLRDELDKAAHANDVKELLRNVGFEASPLFGEPFTQMVKKELNKWEKVVRETDAKVE